MVVTLRATCHLERMQTKSEKLGIFSKRLLSKCLGGIGRVTISCLFLRFMLIFKGNVLENVNVFISKKTCLFLSPGLIFDFLVEKI